MHCIFPIYEAYAYFIFFIKKRRDFLLLALVNKVFLGPCMASLWWKADTHTVKGVMFAFGQSCDSQSRTEGTPIAYHRKRTGCQLILACTDRAGVQVTGETLRIIGPRCRSHHFCLRFELRSHRFAKAQSDHAQDLHNLRSLHWFHRLS